MDGAKRERWGKQELIRKNGADEREKDLTSSSGYLCHWETIQLICGEIRVLGEFCRRNQRKIDISAFWRGYYPSSEKRLVSVYKRGKLSSPKIRLKSKLG